MNCLGLQHLYNLIKIGLKGWLLLAMLCCFQTLTYAQRHEFVLKGVVFKKSTTERLTQVLVNNLANSALAVNDELGTFSIKCATGDTLVFSKRDITAQKIAVASQTDLVVYMQPVIQLSEVSIKGITKKQELQNIMKDYHSKGIYYNGKPPVLSVLNSPLTGLYELFGKAPGEARRFQRYSAHELEQTEIERRFNKPLIKQVTGLTDSVKLQQFITSYKPDYDDVKKWSDYDLIAYIKKSYQYFEINGPKQPLQKLY